MPTFTQVFQASGTGKNGKPYTRWDYKTAEGERFAHFAGTQEIPLNTEVALDVSQSGAINKWQAVGSATPVANPQATPASNPAPQAVSAAPTASGTPSTGSGRDFDAEARGKTRCALVAALLPALFTAQVGKGGEPSPENARVLLDWAFNYVFTPNDVPF